MSSLLQEFHVLCNTMEINQIWANQLENRNIFTSSPSKFVALGTSRSALELVPLSRVAHVLPWEI